MRNTLTVLACTAVIAIGCAILFAWIKFAFWASENDLTQMAIVFGPMVAIPLCIAIYRDLLEKSKL